MSQNKKRNIIIASLCGVLLLMAVGYAAFQSVLNIEGTANITSNWNIKITNIVEKEHVGSASSATDPTHEDLTATFSVNLVSPGDSISYDVTIENQGNLDAELARITVNKGNNPAIKFETEGIEEGDIITTGGNAVLNVKITYDESVTSQPEDTSATFKVTLDYVQKGHKNEWSPSDTVNIGGQNVKVVTEGDGLYADPNSEESGRYVYAGANPDNYITFNGEDAGWRIISIEVNGELKIMKAPANMLPDRAFDTKGKRTTGYCSKGNAPENGCNVYAKTDNYMSANGSYTGAVESDSEMKTYLETEYYPTITTNADAIATNHIWYYGSTYPGYDDYPSEQNLSLMVQEEKKYSFTSNIGLIQASDFIKANSDTEQCGTAKLHFNNSSTCKSTNWMMPPEDKHYWTLSPSGAYTNYVLFVRDSGYLSGRNDARYAFGIVPTLYLKSNIHLEGSGKQDEPYQIESVS